MRGVRSALLDEQRPEFGADYERALQQAHEQLSLRELDRVLTTWRRVAALTQPDPDAAEHLEALPHHAALALAEAVAVLELTPWSGEPINTGNPEGPVRMLAFATAGW